MKEVTKTKEVKYTVFRAMDGTEFYDSQECRKYEESALAVARVRIQELFTGEGKDVWSLMGGMDDHEIIAVKLNNTTDTNTFLQWLYLEHPWYLDDVHKERRTEVEAIIRSARSSGDVILIGKNCEGDYYFINSRQNIIDNLMSLDSKEAEK